MMQIGLRIALISPALLAAAPPASNLTETLTFVPGNTVKGLLARRYLERKGKADATFTELFVTGQTRFGCGQIMGAEVIPLSARSCKYYGGFRRDGSHGVLDLLFADAEVCCANNSCCRSIDYLHGFWDREQYRAISVRTRLITRTAIDPVRGSARTGMLYSQRVMEEGQVFHATIDTTEALISYLTDLVHEPFTGFIGTGASRGQGWVEVQRQEPKPWRIGTARSRFQAYSARLDKPVLVVTLLSDGLFRDDYLREKTAPAIADLEPLKINAADWREELYDKKYINKKKFQQALMDTRLVFGFDGEPIFLPREPRLAVSAGSVFLFEAKNRDPSIPEGDGMGWIGDGNREGYGQAVLWHPFHLQPDAVT